MIVIQVEDYFGYTSIYDSNGNVTHYIDKHTGELVPPVTLTAPSGSKPLTPAQQEKWLAEKEAAEKKYLQRNPQSSFYFTTQKNRCGRIKPQTLARLFFLATYLPFGKNTLHLSERTPLRKSQLPDLMKLKTSAFYQFWSEVEGEYILEQEDGSLEICDDFFRDSIEKHNNRISGCNDYQKVYIQSLRQLYWSVPASKHKYLGYVFLILPHISYEYNILCHNPQETVLNDVKIMTIDELCNLIGYDPTKRARLVNMLTSVIFEFNEREQRFCSYLIDPQQKANFLIINPAVLYRGSDPKRVEALGLFFLDSQDKKRNPKNYQLCG